MLRPLANSLKIFCVALALLLAWPVHAETQKVLPPAVGATREEVVARFGEPKRQLKAGAREVLFFAHWKLTLRNAVVIDVEELADEVPPKRTLVTDGSTVVPPASAPAKASQSAAPPIAPDGDPDPAPTPKNAEAAVVPKTASVDADAPLEIKAIRRPSAGKSPRPPAPAAGAGASPSPVVAVPKTVPVAVISENAKTAPIAVSVASAPVDARPASGAVTAVPHVDSPAPPADASAATASAATDSDDTVAPAAADTKKAKTKFLFRRHRVDPGEPEVSVVTGQTYVLGVIAIICGAAFLWWRRSQRALELAATTVSRTPFEPAEMPTGAMFTADLLGRLDARRFERLVASYYSKTGVVAESTRAGPEAAVHIRIYWKGEPKPFASVQCHAHPSGLIPVKPLQDLFGALSEAEIRRGYVVTTGKFSVEARDFAEEKHFTLLTGDMLLEKLNALPPPARSDLLKETSAESG